MRTAPVLLLILASGSALVAQQPKQALPAKRYGIELDLPKFPEATPKEALASVLKAIELRKVDYLLAQLADPEYVDRRVKQVHAGNFDGMVEETTAKLANDPRRHRLAPRDLGQLGLQLAREGFGAGQIPQFGEF